MVTHALIYIPVNPVHQVPFRTALQLNPTEY